MFPNLSAKIFLTFCEYKTLPDGESKPGLPTRQAEILTTILSRTGYKHSILLKESSDFVK